MEQQTERNAQEKESRVEGRLPYEAPAIVHRSQLEVYAFTNKLTSSTCLNITS